MKLIYILYPQRLTLVFILQEKQFEVIGYRSTWFSLWLWKVHSADAFLQYTLVSIMFGKLWVSTVYTTLILKYLSRFTYMLQQKAFCFCLDIISFCMFHNHCSSLQLCIFFFAFYFLFFVSVNYLFI